MTVDLNAASKSRLAHEGAPQAGDESRPLRYVLVTPARNEAAFIEATIQCAVKQTLKPAKWVIVSDGSTDGTDEIVQAYASRHGWIELVRLDERKERHFAGKVYAFNAGYARLAGETYDVIGNLDADTTFAETYFAFLMSKFAANPRLGVAGTPFVEYFENVRREYDYRFTSTDHVSGACQLFRRECFEMIGGYMPIKIGGIDLIAVITARMKGWETRSFLEQTYTHHRSMGTAQHHPLLVAYRGGKGDFMLGGHPVWEFSRCIYQMTRPPYVLAGLFRLAGFNWAMAKRAPKLVPSEVVQFRRAEQMGRLRAFLKGLFSFGRSVRLAS